MCFNADISKKEERMAHWGQKNVDGWLDFAGEKNPKPTPKQEKPPKPASVER